jgi:probable rRNA maturation factor
VPVVEHAAAQGAPLTGAPVRVDVDDSRPAAGGSADPLVAAGLGVDDLGAVLSAVLAAEGVGAGAEAGLHLVGVDEIAALNGEHLGGEGPTDVLSFPIDGRDEPAVGGPRMVGDVVVCPEVAEAQAAGHAGAVADELRLLVVHGGLHLCGWDHATAGEQQAMWARERELMAALGIPLGRDPWADS